MNKSAGFIKIAVVILAVVFIGALIGIMATRRPEVPPVQVPATVEPPKPMVDNMTPAESSRPLPYAAARGVDDAAGHR